HIFTRMPERVISDIYFDNAGQSLFQAGHYLRLRREGPARELVFRRLTQAARYGHVLQEEVVAKGEGEAFLRSWHLIQRWLSGAIGRPITGDIRGVDEAQNFLSGAGFHPMLEVEVERVPWIVERIDESSSYGAAPHHVAKLKYDQITMRDPDNRGHIIHATEFEATGVESDSASPQGRNRLGYEAFVPAFEEACGYHTSGKKTEHILFAKYFQGMIELGIAKSDPPWIKDQKLRYNVSCFGRNRMMMMTHMTWFNSYSKNQAALSTARTMPERSSSQLLKSFPASFEMKVEVVRRPLLHSSAGALKIAT